MMKAIILLTRRDDMSHDEFVDWWLGQHRGLAEQLPRLRRAVFNVVNDPEPGAPDGVSELWFDSLDDFQSAYASEIGQRVVDDSMANVAGRVRMFVDEHVIAD